MAITGWHLKTQEAHSEYFFQTEQFGKYELKVRTVIDDHMIAAQIDQFIA